MKILKIATRNVVAVASCLVMSCVSALPVVWTDWTSVSGNSASGAMGGVNVTVTGIGALDGVSITSGGGCTDLWVEDLLDLPYTGGTVSNRPTDCEQVGLNLANTITVTFSSAVDKLYMAILSGGRLGYAVTYSFDQSFQIDSEGGGFFGNDPTGGVISGNALTMQEFHGMLLFDQPVTSLTFTNSPNENWHAFTFGTGPEHATVPEPATLALLGLGLFGLGVNKRKKL